MYPVHPAFFNSTFYREHFPMPLNKCWNYLWWLYNFPLLTPSLLEVDQGMGLGVGRSWKEWSWSSCTKWRTSSKKPPWSLSKHIHPVKVQGNVHTWISKPCQQQTSWCRIVFYLSLIVLYSHTDTSFLLCFIAHNVRRSQANCLVSGICHHFEGWDDR